jgi:hypothetical protein
MDHCSGKIPVVSGEEIKRLDERMSNGSTGDVDRIQGVNEAALNLTDVLAVKKGALSGVKFSAGRCIQTPGIDSGGMYLHLPAVQCCSCNLAGNQKPKKDNRWVPFC